VKEIEAIVGDEWPKSISKMRDLIAYLEKNVGDDSRAKRSTGCSTNCSTSSELIHQRAS
jgi:hypothetical protein